MKKAKKLFKNLTIASVGLVLLFAIWLAYFLVKNDAPLITGEVDYGIPYKGELKLDIYTPTKKVYKRSPILFYIHGGAWVGGNKITVNNSRFNGAVNALRERGYTVISPDYTLAETNKSPFPDCILDVYDAIEWTKAHAKQYNLDTTNIGLLGESAGGHIAMMLAFPDTTFIPEKYPKTDFNYIIDVYGPNEMLGIYNSKLADSLDVLAASVPETFQGAFNLKNKIFGFNPAEDTLRAQQMMATYSPYRYLRKFRKPMLIIHGKEDQVVPVEQSLTLKQRLDSLKVPNQMHLLDNVNHGFIGATPEQMDSVQKWIVDFVLENYKQ